MPLDQDDYNLLERIAIALEAISDSLESIDSNLESSLVTISAGSTALQVVQT